jgi:hypothetical protein
VEVWLLEGLKGIGRLFLHPVLYVFFISSFFVGYLRVQRERRDFSFKVYDVWYEIRTSLLAGISMGLLLSLFTIGAGLVLSKASLAVIALWTVVFALLAQYRYLSAAYSVSIAIFFFMFSPQLHTGIASVDTLLANTKGTSLTALALLMSVLLFAEGYLITNHAVRASTPRLLKGKRGLTIGMHVCKRLWFVPLFILVPGDGVKELFAWWPVISIDSQSFSLFLVPFGIGFSKNTKGTLPSKAIFFVGRRVSGLSVLVFVLSLISFWLPGAAIAAAGIAVLGRLTITIRDRIEDEKEPPYFSVQNSGLMILDTMPNSPASEMGLCPGEIITRVNGTVPGSLSEFYKALQHNTAGAFCKMEILDTNGELRLVQRSIYAGEHHELGILFVQRDYEWDTEAV